MIVDASVAVKWFYDEEGADTARDLASSDLIAPDLIYAEVANALWRKQRGGQLTEAIDPVSRIADVLVGTVPSESLAVAAFTMARELDHPVYDCFYLALAFRSGRPLVTADERFLRKCSGTIYAGRLRALAEWDAA